MDKNELWKLLCEKEKQFENAKLKRMVITIMAYAVVIFLIFYITGNPTGLDILGDFLAAVFLAGIHFWINSIIFVQLFSKSEAENKILEDIRKRLSEYEQ